MENFRFHFDNEPDLEKERQKISEQFTVAKKQKQEKIEGEYEKTNEEIKLIQVVNDLVRKEISEIGIITEEYASEDRIHLINQEKAKSLKMDSDGRYHLTGHFILINEDNLEGKKFKAFKVLLHEIIHYYSLHSLAFLKEENNLVIKEYRTGYVSHNPKEDEHEHFRGFNEAVTEKIMEEIIKKNKQYIIDEFNLEKTNFAHRENFDLGYKDEIKILDFIIQKLAEKQNKSPEEIWTKIKRGMFTGEMMHLRDIEKIFGPGSLRFLSAMSSYGSTNEINTEKIYQKIYLFFTEENQIKKNALAKEILSEREFLRYNSSL